MKEGKAILAGSAPLIRTKLRCDQSVGAKPELESPNRSRTAPRASTWSTIRSQDAAIPPRRLAVSGDAVAGVPLPAVDLPGGLGVRGNSDSGFEIPDSRFDFVDFVRGPFSFPRARAVELALPFSFAVLACSAALLRLIPGPLGQWAGG